MKYQIVLSVMLLLSIGIVTALDVSVNDYDPKPAESGRAVNVWFKIDNQLDDPERDVEIEIVPKDGLTLTPGEPAVQRIGIVPGRSSQVVQYRLLVASDAFEGAHSIEASLRSGTAAALKRDLFVEVTEKDLKDVDLQVGDIESDPSRIKPDDDNVKLEVTLLNLGDGRAQGVKVELMSLPDGVILSESYSGTSLLGNIDSDSTSKATFYIDIDKSTVAKEYQAALKVSYKYKPDEEEEDFLFETRQIPLMLAIKPVPIYEITDTELTPTELTAGDKNVRLRITLKNVGEETGDSVRIKVYGKTEQPFSFDKSSDFVAPSLAPGETGQATLEFKVDEDANLQRYFLDIEIKSIVNDDVLTYSDKIEVVVANPKPDNPWGLVLMGVLAIALVIVYLVLRSRRSRKKQKARKVEGAYGKDYLEKMKR
jgi:hypothetical protein